MLRRDTFNPVVLSILLLFALSFFFGCEQISDSGQWEVNLKSQYKIVPNVTYLNANNYEAKLDLYLPRNSTQPNPTVIYIHEGGWVLGNKEDYAFRLLPYMEMGWSLVNVEYRLAHDSLAPSAVEDCRCALRWVIRNAEKYKFDPNKIVLTGHSAGGHLALTTGMLPTSAGLDRQCPGEEKLTVGAIINWYGITDVADLLEGPNLRDFAVTWLGNLENRQEVADRVSPLHYVREGLPPILSVHGAADPIVPYSHTVQLHEALNEVGVPNKMLTIPGGGHGRFGRKETERAYAAIRAFLEENHLVVHKFKNAGKHFERANQT